MTDDRTQMSVRELRLFQSRSKTAEKRNGKRCRCEHDSTPFTPLCSTKKRGTKVMKLARHGVLHLASCQHSTLAETTGPVVSLRVGSRDPLAHLKPIPSLIIR